MENEVVTIMPANTNSEPIKGNIKFCESHYEGTIQPIEFMQAQMNKDEFVGFLKGNIIKYVSRAGKKSSSTILTDLTKARRYLDWLIQVNSGEVINPRN